MKVSPPAGALLRRVRSELERVADPSRAPAMQAYMKSEMPYHGVPAPLFRKTVKAVFAGVPLADAADWTEKVLSLWRGAKFREERYAAIELALDRRAKVFRTPAALPMAEEMIVTGAWWDYVDSLAKNLVGDILSRDPGVKRTMLEWSRSGDLWKRRTAILCQLGFKKSTDLDLLYRAIEPAIDSKEFFLRKAIGWALREYAWVDPAEVVRYVRENEERLSPLSRREALKNVARAGK